MLSLFVPFLDPEYGGLLKWGVPLNHQSMIPLYKPTISVYPPFMESPISMSQGILQTYDSPWPELAKLPGKSLKWPCNRNRERLEVPIPYIFGLGLYFSGLCKGISQQNMAKNIVTYLHQLDPEDLPLFWRMMTGLQQALNSKPPKEKTVSQPQKRIMWVQHCHNTPMTGEW